MPLHPSRGFPHITPVLVLRCVITEFQYLQNTGTSAWKFMPNFDLGFWTWHVCYIHQVNGVKLADILFSLVCVCVCIRPSVCAHSVFRCKYLENGLR